MKFTLFVTLFLLHLFCQEIFGAAANYNCNFNLNRTTSSSNIRRKRYISKDFTLNYDAEFAQQWEKKTNADIKIRVLEKHVIPVHSQVIQRVPDLAVFVNEKYRNNPKSRREIHVVSATELFTETRTNEQLRSYVQKQLQPSLPNALTVFIKSLYVGDKALDDINKIEEAILVRKLYNRFLNEDVAKVEMTLTFKRLLNDSNNQVLYEFGRLRNLDYVLQYWSKHVEEQREQYLHKQIECKAIKDNYHYLDDFLSALRLPVPEFVKRVQQYRDQCKDVHVQVALNDSRSFPKSIQQELFHMNEKEIKMLYDNKLISKEEYDHEIKIRQKPPPKLAAECPCQKLVKEIDIHFSFQSSIVRHLS